MITAHESLRALQDAGASDFAQTRLASDLSPVTRAVRRHRVVRASVTAAAGVAAIGGIAVWNVQHRATPTPIAGELPSPSVSMSAEPSPASSPSAESVELVPEGARIDVTVEGLAEVYGVSEEAAREALVAELHPLANGEPEGWVAWDGGPPSATLEQTAHQLVAWQMQNLQDMGVAEEDWLATLTLASILVKESADPQYWAQISRVIHNRLDAGMTLDLESPLVYITRADEQTVSDDGFVVDSPYNTFMYTGLPPTPIGSAGLAAIDAAAHPAQGEELFFLRDPHSDAVLFATTLHEHQLNAFELGLIEEDDILPE